MKEQLEPPTILLLLQALETLGDPDGIRCVKQFLTDSEDNEFRFPLWGCDRDWTTSLRFAVELRAVRTLMSLGCADENHRLENYVNHQSLTVRRYARRLAGAESRPRFVTA